MLLWSGTGSRPAAERVCRPCRRAGAGRSCQLPRHRFTHRTCPQCDAEFCPAAARQVTCSRRCGQLQRTDKLSEAERAERRRLHWQAKNRRRRAAKRDARSEPYTLAEIAARDRFRCQLCGCKVDMTLRRPDVMSPTIDHVIPIVEGGDDVRANVQLAHLRCNSSKGARGSQQLALVG
jgi:hypothetical protein